MKEMNYFNEECFDDEFTIDLKKIFLALWSRKWLMLKVGVIIFTLIVFSTFITPKKYLVDSDLYINKSNNTNMAEINPYFINEVGKVSLTPMSDKVMSDELEIMQSPLVIDKVIQENDLRYKPLFGFISTPKTGKLLTTEKFLKRKVKFENKKGTNVVSISYKDKDRELAYKVVTSIITHYIELHKELNSEKSKSDKKLLEAEYTKAKENLNAKINNVGGLPVVALNGTGNLAAMSAFSKSAQGAIAQLQSQIVAGEKSQLILKEESEKVAQLSSKLQWAKLVDEMSASSKVLILKEPRLLEDYEQTSPKLFTNIFLGIILGIVGALISFIVVEQMDKKLCYMNLGDKVIYDLDKEIKNFKACVYKNRDSKIGFIFFDNITKRYIKEYWNKISFGY